MVKKVLNFFHEFLPVVAVIALLIIFSYGCEQEADERAYERQNEIDAAYERGKEVGYENAYKENQAYFESDTFDEELRDYFWYSLDEMSYEELRSYINERFWEKGCYTYDEFVSAYIVGYNHAKNGIENIAEQYQEPDEEGMRQAEDFFSVETYDEEFFDEERWIE